ncbi:uncharacterized protein DMENIID0001_088980 [Sergentomyia squamirostris]
MVVKRLECLELTKDYGNVTCSLNLKNRTTSYVQVDYVPFFDIYPLIKITLNYRFTVYRKFLIDVTEDFCAFMKGKKSAPVVSILWESLNAAGNLKTGCPHKKGEHYYVKDYVIDEKKFPPAMPTGDYRIDITIINNVDKVQMLTVQMFVLIQRKPEADITWN